MRRIASTPRSAAKVEIHLPNHRLRLVSRPEKIGQHSSAVEQRFCKPPVVGSIPTVGSTLKSLQSPKIKASSVTGQNSGKSTGKHEKAPKAPK